MLFVLDFSGSMAEPVELRGEGTAAAGGPQGTKADLVVRELKKMVMALPDGALVNFVVFSEDVRIWRGEDDRPALVRLDDESRDDLLGTYLDGLRPSGPTNLYGALRAALDFGGRGLYDRYYGAGFDTLYVISDGAPSAGEVVDKQEIRRRVREANQLRKNHDPLRDVRQQERHRLSCGRWPRRTAGVTSTSSDARAQRRRRCGRVRPRFRSAPGRAGSLFFFNHALASATLANFCPVIANSASRTFSRQIAQACQRAFQYSAGGFSAASTSFGAGSSKLSSNIGIRLLLLVLGYQLEDGLVHGHRLRVVARLEHAVDDAPVLRPVAARRDAANQAGVQLRMHGDLRIAEQLAHRGAGQLGRLVEQHAERLAPHHDRLLGLDHALQRLDQVLAAPPAQLVEGAACDRPMLAFLLRSVFSNARTFFFAVRSSHCSTARFGALASTGLGRTGSGAGFGSWQTNRLATRTTSMAVP